MSFLHGVLREMNTYAGFADFDFRDEDRRKFYELAQLAVNESLRMFKDGEKAELAKNLAEIAKSIKEEKLVREEFFYKLPESFAADLFRSIQDVETKKEFACLVGNGERLTELIIARWKEGSVEDAAILYGSAYLDNHRDSEGLPGWRLGALSGVPNEVLRALFEYPWDEETSGGIKSWIRQEIEEL